MPDSDVDFLSGSNNEQVTLTKLTADSRERIVYIICTTVVIVLICIGLIVALFISERGKQDYVSMILPVVSGSIFGFLGYRVGSRRTEEK